MDQTNATLSKGGGSGELGHTKMYHQPNKIGNHGQQFNQIIKKQGPLSNINAAFDAIGPHEGVNEMSE